MREEQLLILWCTTIYLLFVTRSLAGIIIGDDDDDDGDDGDFCDLSIVFFSILNDDWARN